jgi:hypothetical protein
MVLATCCAFLRVALRRRLRVFRAFFAVPYPALNLGGCVGLLKTAMGLYSLVILLVAATLEEVYKENKYCCHKYSLHIYSEGLIEHLFFFF